MAVAVSPTSVAANSASETQMTTSCVAAGAAAVVTAMGNGGSVDDSM